MKLINDWRSAGKFWSLWVAAFWGAVGGAILILPAFIGVINPWVLGIVMLVMSASFAVARLLKQPGTG